MKKVYQKLQLDNILQQVAKHAISDVAKNKILTALPSNEIDVVRHLLSETAEACRNISVYNINPDIAIAVDVSFALSHNDDPIKCGKINAGPMIGISPTLSKEISDSLIDTAKSNNIPWQTEIMNGTTGTNADRFSVSRGGVKSCTLSIPLRYMHTPSEIISVTDVQNTGKLLAEWIRRSVSC